MGAFAEKSPALSEVPGTWRRLRAGFVLANGSMSTSTSGEGGIRRAIVEADLVDRTHRELIEDEIARIADTYRVWQDAIGAGDYAGVPSFCKNTLLVSAQVDSVYSSRRDP